MIAHRNTISIPIDQSGQHLNNLSSNIVGKNTVKGGYLGQGDKKKDKVRRSEKTVGKGILFSPEE